MVSLREEEPLSKSGGKYVKHVTASRALRAMSVKILKNSMGILQAFNDVRHNGSFAHDNDIPSERSPLILTRVVCSLRFVKALWSAVT